MSVRAARWSRDGPPSTRYAASVNGAPREADQRRRAERGDGERDPSVTGAAPRASAGRGRAGGRRRRRCAPREPSTGPTPGLISTSTPGQPQRHDDVGEEDRRVHVVPAHRLQRDLAGERRVQAGLQHRGARPRASRYSGSDLPACRMNHTGRRDGASPEYARTSEEFVVRPSTRGCEEGRFTSPIVPDNCRDD